MAARPSRVRDLRTPLASALALLLASACGAPAERVGETSSAIVGGSDSDSSQDFVVRILLTLDSGACTGFLVAPDLVMTAQHCLTSGFVLTAGGENDINTCKLSTTPLPISQFQPVIFGPDAANPTFTVPVIKAYIDESNEDCSKDVAFLQLASPVTSVTIHPLRLDGPVQLGEAVTEIGWGDVDDNFTAPQTRQQESGTIVQTAEGPGHGSPVTPLGVSLVGQIPPGYIAANITACNGDSGSPWLDSSGNVVGLVDQAVSDQSIATAGGTRQSKCSDDVTLAASLQAVTPFVEQVFQATGRMPWRAGRDAPPNDVGGACSISNECNSDYCVTIADGTGYCSMTCSASTPCPSSTQCTDTGGSSPVCLPQEAAPTPRGCSVGAGRDDDASLAAAAAGLLALATARARKRRAAPASDVKSTTGGAPSPNSRRPW
jgi:hypothetical protein